MSERQIWGFFPLFFFLREREEGKEKRQFLGLLIYVFTA